MIGKLRIADTTIIIIRNCLISSFIKYHLARIIDPTTTDNPKKISKPISPNGTLA